MPTTQNPARSNTGPVPANAMVTFIRPGGFDGGRLGRDTNVGRVDIAGVDERDSNWEDRRPRFRVYLFAGGAPGTSWVTDTYDVTGADVLEVIAWAQEEAGDDQLYAIALVCDDNTRPAGTRRGLTWLVGMDANDTPADEHDQRRQAAMLARRGKRDINLG